MRDLIPHDFIDPSASKSRHAIPNFDDLRQEIMAARIFQAERRAWNYVRQSNGVWCVTRGSQKLYSEKDGDFVLVLIPS